jgi:hypothetical protein
MGYDMHWVKKPAGEQEKVDKLREDMREIWSRTRAIPEPERGVGDAWEALMKEADAKENEIRDTEKSYFRLNIWGMSYFVAAMEQLEMLYWSSDSEPWPDRTARTVELMDAVRNDLSFEATREEVKEAHAAIKYEAERLAAHPEPPKEYDGIPSHKFDSNNGWLVTPAEIHAALATYNNIPSDMVDAVLEETKIDREIWDRWIAYLTGATEHGGFEVH